MVVQNCDEEDGYLRSHSEKLSKLWDVTSSKYGGRSYSTFLLSVLGSREMLHGRILVLCCLERFANERVGGGAVESCG